MIFKFTGPGHVIIFTRLTPGTTGHLSVDNYWVGQWTAPYDV